MIADPINSIGSALTPDDVVRGVRHLPSAPKVLPRLKQLLSDGNSAMHEIVALIRLDAGIAARVLQVANSAFYSKGIRCFTVDEAVNRVGYAQVYELVSYAVASQVLVRPLTTYGIEADELWRLSVSCALAAEVLALRTGQDRNVAYTIGLLHGVGMVAIDEWVTRNLPTLSFASTGLPREATENERAALGFTQADTGAALLRHWGFPPSISEPVRWQYAPRASASQMRMAALLQAAKWLRTCICAGGAPRPPAPEAANLQLLGIGHATLNSFLVEVGTRLEEVNSLLELGGGSGGDHEHRFPSNSWR